MPGTEQPVRTVIYARVSTEEQVAGTSLGTQLDRCRSYSVGQGWEVVGEYVDEGVSGAKASRPALDRAMAEVRQGNTAVLVVAKLDRIGRSMRNLAALLGELDDRGVSLVSVSESFDSLTPAGRLQRNMLGSFAEFERAIIKERMTAGQEATARAGRWVGGPPPFGYKIEGREREARLVIDQDEAAVITLAVDLLVGQRLSTGQVAKELNGRGMRPRRAPRWNGHNMRRLMQNATAISGKWVWRRPGRESGGPPITMVTPAIITAEMHERLRARLAETGHTRHDDRYMLAGRITSPCGGHMYGMTSSAPVYRCQHTFPTAIERCSCRTVRVEAADTAVWAQVRQVLADPVRLLSMSGIELDRAVAATDVGTEDLAAIDRRVARLERAAGEQLSKMLASGLDAAVAQHATKALTDDLTAARAHRDRVAAWQVANAERVDRSNRLWELASRAQETLGEADMATRRRVLDLLEVHVTVTGWVRCPTCDGAGWVASGRWTGNKTFYEAGKVCSTCLRHRWIPQDSHRRCARGHLPRTRPGRPGRGPLALPGPQRIRLSMSGH